MESNIKTTDQYFVTYNVATSNNKLNACGIRQVKLRSDGHKIGPVASQRHVFLKGVGSVVWATTTNDGLFKIYFHLFLTISTENKQHDSHDPQLGNQGFHSESALRKVKNPDVGKLVQ